MQLSRRSFLSVLFAASTSLVGCSLPWNSRRVTIGSFNVRHCVGMDGKLEVGRTASRIVALAADYIGLQELDARTKRAREVDQPAELARMTSYHMTFAKTIDFQGGEYGIGLLSRTEPLSVVKKPLPGAEPRMLLLCEFADCWVGTTHLSVSRESERVESVELIRAALDEIRQSTNKPVFLTGDWNAEPDSSVLKGLGEFITVLSTTAGRTFHGKTNGPSVKGDDYCIDYIAVDSAHAEKCAMVSSEVVEDRLTSDHAPIVVSFDLSL